MKEVSVKEILDQMDESVHGAIVDKAKEYKSTHMVLFQCIQMDSSAFGAKTVSFVGPNNTAKTIEDAQKMVLNGDTVSRRQYPQLYARIDETE